MGARALVAGVGNVFLGDDGFGVEVVRHLQPKDVPDGVRVEDFGIRGVHLAFDLLEPPGLLVIVDAVSRGAAPGTLFVIEPDLDGPLPVADNHSMDVHAVFTQVRAMGGMLPPVRIVGCQPAFLGERMGLSPPVEAAIEPAAALVHKILLDELRGADVRAGGGTPR
ncbi:MAG TPA: hydrogenase maturation protease [Vulgatibacter sp.]|nr:hydrogenase maturation protease [Vulgatibacter sp.]